MNPSALAPVIPGMGGLALKVLLALVLVLVVILGLQRLARRWGRTLGGGSGSDGIRILSTRTLAPRLSLTLVQVRDRCLLLGVSPQGVHAVADLGNGEGAPLPAAGPTPVVAEAVTEKAPDFEGELVRRLATLRQQYRSVGEAQLRLGEDADEVR
jgi:flagellar biosynthetic protein FliO